VINSAVLMGRLTADPELRTTQSGKSVASFSLAVDRDFQQNGEKQADFISVVAWGKTAEFIDKYFRKGRMIAVVGRIQTRTYTDKDGNNRKVVEVVADKVSFTGEKADTAAQEPSRIEGYEPASKTRSPVANTVDMHENTNSEDFTEISNDDDLPF